ncbi:MAG: thioredoxin family protein [Verrucomicrobiia bacterium Tous-C2TDCM]|nr:MAG: thioredoxin family protein [Verrucomicrobiae bacterium Tous-C2TDCM]
MAETASTFRLEPGASAPEFALPDRTGLLHRPDTLVSGKRGLLVVFACNHCPYVVHLADALGRFADGIASRGVATVAIASNDADRYPQDGPDRLTDFAESHGWEFPYLHDATQEVAHAYAAACTPDFYLFDAGLSLVYAGQFDDSRPGKGFPTGSDLARAVDNLLSGRETPPPWYPSTGCNIKWRPGNEPDYFG